MAAKAKRPTERLEDLDKAPQIKKLRDQGKTWAEIAKKLKMTAGRAQFIKLVSEVKPSQRIKFKDDDDLAKKIIAARDKDNLGWAVISARTGVTEGRVKDMYRRVKDGRPASGERGKRPTSKGKSKTKSAAKKGSAAKRNPAGAKRVAKAKPKAKRTARRKASNPSS